MKKTRLYVIQGLLLAVLAFGASPLMAGNTYILHFGGMCSTQYEGGGDKGVGRLANVPGAISVDGMIDVTVSIPHAANEIRQRFDQYCTGSNWCYVINYSGGDANTRYALSNYNASNWNIAWVGSNSGAGGGSRLALGWLANVFTCSYTSDLWPSTVRNMFNHDDTGGKTIYHVAGTKTWWYTNWLLPNKNDGAVGFDSQAGCRSTGSYSSMCSCNHYNGHFVAFTCSGYNLDHYDMKSQFQTVMGW